MFVYALRVPFVNLTFCPRMHSINPSMVNHTPLFVYAISLTWLRGFLKDILCSIGYNGYSVGSGDSVAFAPGIRYIARRVCSVRSPHLSPTTSLLTFALVSLVLSCFPTGVYSRLFGNSCSISKRPYACVYRRKQYSTFCCNKTGIHFFTRYTRICCEEANICDLLDDNHFPGSCVTLRPVRRTIRY